MIHDRYLEVMGLRTHFLEGGAGTPLVWLHGADFGTSAALCWEPNLAPFSDRFHVLAPDLLGYGETAKVYSFEDMRLLRRQHLEAFLGLHCLEPAWLIGNSAGASTALELAASPRTAGLVAGVVAVAGGGPNAADNEGRRALNAYDGSIEAMAAILRELFSAPRWAEGDYLARRHGATLVPGLYECFAAAGLTRPGGRTASQGRVQPDFGAIRVPTLIVGGSDDRLKPVDELETLAAAIDGSELLVVDKARHWPHVEHAEQFNAAVLDFIERRGS